jgi:hypothetical protein
MAIGHELDGAMNFRPASEQGFNPAHCPGIATDYQHLGGCSWHATQHATTAVVVTPRLSAGRVDEMPLATKLRLSMGISSGKE